MENAKRSRVETLAAFIVLVYGVASVFDISVLFYVVIGVGLVALCLGIALLVKSGPYAGKAGRHFLLRLLFEMLVVCVFVTPAVFGLLP